MIKERSSFEEFFDSRPEAAGKGGEDGFVDDPFLSGVIGIVVNRDEVIEGFDQFGFRLGGVEVGRCRCQFSLMMRIEAGVSRLI